MSISFLPHIAVTQETRGCMLTCVLYFNMFVQEQRVNNYSHQSRWTKKKKERKQQFILFPIPTGERTPPAHDLFTRGLHNITESSRLWPGLQTPLIPIQLCVPGLCWNPGWSLLHLSRPLGSLGTWPPPNYILRGFLFMLPDTLIPSGTGLAEIFNDTQRHL